MTKLLFNSTKLIKLPSIFEQNFFASLSDFVLRIVSIGDFISAFRMRL